ncbi:MAG: TA system VapC family ribonuclease toxin [Myxococcota bacterium]
MFVVDTNILLYAAERSFPEHERARAALLDWRQGAAAWFLTWKLIYEFVRVATHPRVFVRPWSAPAAWEFVEALLASPGLQILVETSRHPEVAATVWREVVDLRGNLVHDVHTAIVMREHGIRDICTRDTDFNRFPFLRVVDPLV